MPFAALSDSRASEVESKRRSRREDDAEATGRVRLVTGICRQLTRFEMERVFKNKQILHDIYKPG